MGNETGDGIDVSFETPSVFLPPFLLGDNQLLLFALVERELSDALVRNLQFHAYSRVNSFV